VLWAEPNPKEIAAINFTSPIPIEFRINNEGNRWKTVIEIPDSNTSLRKARTWEKVEHNNMAKVNRLGIK
jgi:hypothetical protein